LRSASLRRWGWWLAIVVRDPLALVARRCILVQGGDGLLDMALEVRVALAAIVLGRGHKVVVPTVVLLVTVSGGASAAAALLCVV
jgi:hypothetical protein